MQRKWLGIAVALTATVAAAADARAAEFGLSTQSCWPDHCTVELLIAGGALASNLTIEFPTSRRATILSTGLEPDVPLANGCVGARLIICDEDTWQTTVRPGDTYFELAPSVDLRREDFELWARLGPGDDVVELRNSAAARQRVDGDSGNDVLYGSPSSGMQEQLHGGDGRDHVDGRGGDDLVVGGSGSDVIIGGPGRDAIWTGGAQLDDADVVYARDGEQDTINCSGYAGDEIYADPVDTLYGCGLAVLK